MKILSLLFLLTISISAQSWIPQGNGYTYSFDLKYGGSATSDSIAHIDFDLQYGNITTIIVEGNANDPVDSIYIRYGAKQIDSYGSAPSDTIWGSYAALKDSSGKIVNVIVNQSTGKHFFIYEPALDVLEIGLLNHRPTLDDRKVELTIKTRKSTITQ